MMRAAGGSVPPNTSLLTRQRLKNLGDRAVELADGLQKYGLVDYQLGFREEEVITSKHSNAI